jgi:hypothetical protein
MAAGLCVIGLLCWSLFRDAPVDRGGFDVRLLAVTRFTNGAVQVSLELSNGSSRVLNVVDDSTGSPALVLEVPGQTRWLNRPANTGRMTLGTSSNLTTSAWVTNPPPRFRLLFSVRDFDAERRMDSTRRLLPKALRSDFTEWSRDLWNSTNPASPWIE